MRFREEYWFLSNFYPATVFGYPSAEHAFVAAKTTVPDERALVKRCATPAAAKKLGRTLTMRREWRDPAFRLEVMETMVREKFVRHPELRAQLVATGDLELVEDNWWGDTFWGVCDGKGSNHLGKILMKVRDELKS